MHLLPNTESDINLLLDSYGIEVQMGYKIYFH